MNRKALCAMVFLVAAGFDLCAQENPFFLGTGSVAESRTSDTAVFLRRSLDRINGFQRELNARLAEFSRITKGEWNAAVFFTILAIAFAYGLVHALGPGHGKTIMVSYALANPLKAKQGVILGIGAAVVHTLSAVVLVSVLYLILRGSYSQYTGEPKKIVSLVSYGLIAGMGAFLLFKAVRAAWRTEGKGGISEKTSGYPEKKIRDLVGPAFLMGLVPCEGAVLILVFSLSIDAFWLGTVLAAAMSAGMAVTISAAGLFTLGVKKGTLKALSRRKALVGVLVSVFQITGAAVILLLGLLLFMATIRG